MEVSPGADALFNKPMNEVATIHVPIRTLDSVFADCGLERLDLLKVDVQGYETEVFAGGVDTLRRTRLLVTEVSFFEHYKGQPQFGEVYACLRELGFELRSLFGHSYDGRGLPLQCDAMFVNRAEPCPAS
jgi:hypothetical protein